MKKLLTILGSLGLVLTSGSAVISCSPSSSSSDDNDPIDPTQDVVADLKEAFETANNNVATSDTTKLKLTRTLDVTQEDNSSYKLFNYDVLKDLEYNEQTSELDFSNNSELKTSAINDLSILLDTTQYSDEIKSQIANNSEFKNVYIGTSSATIGSFKIDSNGSAVIKKTIDPKDDEEQEDTYLFSLQFTFTKTFNYYDLTGSLTSYTCLPRTINLLIGSENGITTKIKQISEEAGNYLFENSSSIFTYEQLNSIDETFKKYGNIGEPLRNKINNSPEITNLLKEKIDSVFASSGFTSSVQAYDKDKGIITDSDKIIQTESYLDSKNSFKNANFITNVNTNPLLKNLFLYNEDNGGTQITDEDANKGLKQIISNLDSTTTTFNTNFVKWGETVDPAFDSTKLDTLSQSVYSYGTFEIDGLSIKLEKDGGTTEVIIPSIKTPWTYSVSLENDKTDDYFSSLYTSLKEVNKNAFKINEYDSQKNSLLIAGSELQNSFLANANTDYNSIAKLSEYLDKNNSLATKTFRNGAPMFDLYSNLNLEDDSLYSFNNLSGFLTPNNTKIVKTPDGRIGFKAASTSLDFQIKFTIGNLRFQFKFNKSETSGYNGDDIKGNYSDTLLSSGKSVSTWISEHVANDDSLIFELGKVDTTK